MGMRTKDRSIERSGSGFVAIDVSKRQWLVAGYRSSDGRTARYRCRGGEIETLLGIIAKLCRKETAALGRPVEAIACHEAGYQGFWLHRRLIAAGIESHLMDATSLLVDRRARRVKTDAIDAEALLRALIAYCRGDKSVCRMVRVPNLEEEDSKRTHRERRRLVKERTGHINRIKALLALHGIDDYQPIKADRRRRLSALVIPSPAEADSRKGFPHRRGSDSTWRTQGGLPWQLPFCSEETMTPPRFAGWHGRRRTAIRPDGCSRWRRSMTAAVAAMRRRSAVSGCRLFVTGGGGSMPKAPTA